MSDVRQRRRPSSGWLPGAESAYLMAPALVCEQALPSVKSGADIKPPSRTSFAAPSSMGAWAEVPAGQRLASLPAIFGRERFDARHDSKSLHRSA
jgi:hypothetical protein